jgi:glycosyltransferase involved in cell wall biosynthesis
LSLEEKHSPELSVVILCYRAEKGVEPFVEDIVKRLNKEIEDWELILVGNFIPGSDDLTPHFVRKMAASDSRIRALTLKKGGMMGWDARSGFEAATGKVIALIDGDGQMPGRDILRAYHVMNRTNADLVKTYRIYRNDGVYRRIISNVFNVCFKCLFLGFAIRDVNGKPKLMTRNAYEKLRLSSSDWFIDAEILIQARRLGFRLAEIPTVFHALENRRSFVRLPAIFEFLKNLVLARLKEFRFR